MSILGKIGENVDCSQNFRKMLVWVAICKYLEVYENLGFGQNCRENLDLGQHFWKISILVNIFGKID